MRKKVACFRIEMTHSGRSSGSVVATFWRGKNPECRSSRFFQWEPCIWRIRWSVRFRWKLQYQSAELAV